MAYRLKVYGNFHYADESETYYHGNYSTYDEALRAAQQIVEEFLMENYKQGMDWESLLSYYYF